MGRRPDPVRRHFQRLDDEPCYKFNELYHLCLHCMAAKKAVDTDARRNNTNSVAPAVLPRIHGSKPALSKHLANCPNSTDARMALAASEAAAMAELRPAANSASSASPLTQSQVDCIVRCLIEFQAENRLPDTFNERPSTLRFIGSLNAAAVERLPARRALTDLLNKYAAEVSAEEALGVMELQNISGGRVNFLRDVWQNIVKIHLLGCQLALFGAILAFGLFPTGSRHDGFTLAKQIEKLMVKAEAQCWKIGAVVTDNAGQCNRARQILAVCWPRVVF
jgi:hypothetical protein